MRPRYQRWSFIRAQHGTAAVEFAMVLPVLLVLLFGAIELGRLLHDFHVVSKSIRDATRYLSRVAASCPGGAGAGTVVDPNDETAARNLALTGAIDPPTDAGDYLLSYWTDPSTVAINVDCVENTGQFKGVFEDSPFVPRLTVAATVPFDFLVGSFFLASTTITMQISHNEVNIGE